MVTRHPAGLPLRWEARDPHGRRVSTFVFYLLKADVVPAPAAGAAAAQYLPEYGKVSKKRIREFSCAERARTRGV